MTHRRLQGGQSLIELTVALGLGIIFITGAIGALTVSLRLSSETNYGQPALELSRELTEQLRTVVNSDWNTLGGLTIDGAAEYRVTPTETFYTIEAGVRTVVLNNATYTSYFVLSPVYRLTDGSMSEDGIIDPSTIKATTITSWSHYGQTNDVRFTTYLARIRNRAWIHTDWINGGAGEVIDASPPARFSTSTNTNYASTSGQITIEDLTANHATTTGNGVDPLYRYAFSDLSGWLDFGNGSVTFSANATTTGYATSSVGEISLDCATTPAGNICNQSLFGVMQDNNNVLSGFGWNETLGWISFNCNSVVPANCGADGGYDYRVTIDPLTGFLYGWAWSDTGGWISFNCDRTNDGTPPPENINMCSTSRGGTNQSDYGVRTGISTVSLAVVTSTIFDPGSSVTLNTITWIGTPQTGTGVALQIATSTSSAGPWTFVGPNGTPNSVYRPTGSGIPKALDRSMFTGVRYFRYRVILESDPLFSVSPIIKDVIISYSL